MAGGINTAISALNHEYMPSCNYNIVLWSTLYLRSCLLNGMKSFNVPIIYRSPLITAIKNRRKQEDKMKKDFSPALLELGPLKIYLARHFGFCYGVENAIEISFR